MNIKISQTSPLTSPKIRSSEAGKLLTVSAIFSSGLVMVRIIHTGKLTFVSLVWNLFLAYVPYFLSHFISGRTWMKDKKLFALLFFLVWIFWIPNSFYIITDLFHLSDELNLSSVPAWYDLILISSFAWNGMLLGILSVREMEKIFWSHVRIKHELFFLYPVMWLNALGVYTGRYLRFNSWDAIMSPFQLFMDIGEVLIHPAKYPGAWAMILCFSIWLTLIYLTLKRVSRAI
ncbi:MAG: DUF1361 domain-containing protein [Chitinophagales bacterium]